MKILATALLLACAPMAAHAAENFTFKSTGKTIDGVRTPADPAPGASFQGVQVSTLSSDATYPDGHKETTTGKCGQWRAPAGSQFPGQGVCTTDVYSLNFSCQAADKPNESNCWGLLTGTGGRFKGRTGLVAWRTTQGAGNSGVGTWN